MTVRSLDHLSEQDLNFIQILISDDLWRPLYAARKAGYKNCSQAVARLMKKPSVIKALGREQRRRMERLELRADEVLSMLATGLFFNPLSLFKPSKDGKWVVEDLDKVPAEIGRCVEEVKCRTVEEMQEDGTVKTTTYFELKMMGKTKLLELAMKHMGIAGDQKVVHTGNVGVDIGLSGGLNALLMNIERTRSRQVVDAEVLETKFIEDQRNVQRNSGDDPA
jgi:phage terminase small subunit